ncbi:MAG: GNAT family N-acetyltransferase [Rhodoglobus sp.]
MGNDDWVVVGTGQQSPTGEVKSVIGGIITHTPGWLGHADWFENMVVRDEAGRFADQIGGIGSIARADIPDTRLPDPTPITFMGRPVAMTEVDISNVSTTRAVTAFIPIKDDDSWHAFAIGVLTWDRDTHEVELAFVQADVRRTGVATALYEFARTIEPDLKHSPERSPSGSAFAASIDPDLPKATRPLSDADAHAMGSRLMVAVTGFGSDDTIGEPALATRKPPTIAQGPVIGERIGVPLTDISQIRPGSGTYEGTVAPDAPRVFRNVGNIAELDQAIRVGSWNASTGGFTVRAMEGDTQFTADYEQAKRWKHHLRNEVGNRLLIEADITGLPVRFIGREEAEPTDAYGHEWPQTLTSTHFYPSTSTGIGVVGDIPLDRIKNVSMLRDDGSVHEFGSWDAFVTWREGGGPYVAQGPIVEAPDSVMLEAHLGQVLARFQEPAGVRDLFGTGGDAESPTMTFEQRLTHCYDLSASALFYGAPEGSKLVHGTIHGWGAPRRIGHGWLELPDGKVWEPITAKVYDKNEWTIWAGAEVERVYTKTEAVHHLVDSGHYGRWHDSIYPAPLPPGDPTTPLNDQIMWEHRPVQGPLLDVLKAMVDPKFDGLPQEAIDKYHATLAEADAKESGGVQRWYDKNGAGLPGPRRDQLNQVLLPWDPTHRLPKVVDPDFPALAAALVARDVEMLRGNAEFMLEDARRRARLTAAYYEDQRKYREWAADLTPITDPGPILSLDAADTRISIAHGDEGQPRLSQAHGRFARVLASALPQGYSLMFYGREDTGDSGFADGTQFVGNIMHEGHIVGHFDRQDLGNGDVYNRHLDVVKEGIGLGTQWVARSMEAYRAAGYKRLHVRAGLESGGIVWAKAGFEFDVITPGQDLPTGQLATSSASGWGQHPLLALEVSQDPEVVAWRTLHPVDYQREATGGYGLPRPRISPSPREMHDAGGAVRQLLIGSEWTGIMDLTEAKSGEPTGFAAFLAYIAEHPNGDPEAELFDNPRQPATPEVKGIGGIARHAIGAVGDAAPNRGGWWAGTGFREDLVVRDTEGRFVDRLGIGGIALPDSPRIAQGPLPETSGLPGVPSVEEVAHVRATTERPTTANPTVRWDRGVSSRLRQKAGTDGLWRSRLVTGGKDRPEGERAYLDHTVAVHEPTPAVVAVMAEAEADPVTFLELDHSPEAAAAFADAITTASSHHEFGAAVYVYPADEYAAMRLFIAPDGSTGFAIKDDGDMVSAFADPDHPAKPRQAVISLMEAGIDNGGTHLDAFDPLLPRLYGQHGFKAVARVSFDPAEAPPNWPAKAGTPDVVFMVYDSAYDAGYAPGDGVRVPDYDAGVATVQRALSPVPATMWEGAPPAQTRRNFGADLFWESVGGGDFTESEQSRLHPERYIDRRVNNLNPGASSGPLLRQGAIETRLDATPGKPPTLYDVTPFTPDQNWDSVPKDQIEPGSMGDGDGGGPPRAGGSSKPLRRIPGSERPLPAVFRIVDEAEYQQALKRGYFQSDERMNLGDEGTVASTRSTGTFYAPWGSRSGPQDGQARIVRLRMDPADGWLTDADSYVKTHERIPVDRIEKVTPPFTKAEASAPAAPPIARAPLPPASKMVPAMPDWYFADQAPQYPATGPDGVSYFKGVIDSKNHVDCLLFYKDGALVGILNHFPQDFPAAGERKGNITVIVDPAHRRQRIGAELTAEAVKRWDVDLSAQDTTPMGRAFLDAAGPTLNPFTGGDGVAQYATIPSTLGWLIEVAVRMAGPGDDEPKGPSDPPRVVVPAKDPAPRRPSRFKPLKGGTAPKMSRPYGLGALIGVDPPVRPARRNLPGGARGYLTLAGGAGLAHGPILDTKPDAKPTVQDVTTMPLVLPRSSEGVALTPGTKAIMALHTFKRLFPDADPHHRRHVVVTQVGRGAVDVEFSNDPRYGEDNTNLGPVTVTGKDLFAARNSVIPKGYGHNGRQIRVGSVVQMGQGYVGGADRTGSYGVILSKGPDADDPTEEMWEIRLPDGQVVNKWASTLRVTTTTHKFNHDAGDAQVGDVLSWVASDGNLHKDKILAVDTAHDGTVLISFAPPTKDKPNPNGLILGMPTPSGPRPETVTLLRFRPNDPVALTRLTVHTSQELNAARNKAVAALPSDHNLIGRRKQMFADDPELVRLTTLRDNQSIRAADWAAWRDGAHANTLKLIEPAYDLFAEPPAGYPWPMTSADVDVQIKQDTESAAHLDGKVNEFRAWVQGTDPSYVRRGFRYEPDIALDGGPGEATLAHLRTVTEVGATLAEAINARYLAKMDVASMVDPDVARARRDVLDRQSGDTYRRENDVREAALLAYALEKYGMSDPHTQAHEIVDSAQRDKVIVDLFGLEQQHERAQSNPEWLALMEERKAIYAKVDKINLDMHVAEGLARANRMHAVREILAEIRPTGGTLPLSHPLTPDVEPLHLPMDEVQVGDKMLTPQGLSLITAISREGEAPDLFEGLGDPDSELTRLASLLDERPWILTITDPNGKSAVGILSAEHVSARNATLSVYRGDVALTETPDPVALEALTTALSMYPTSWVKSAAGRGPLIVAPDDGTRRGSFNDEKNIISLPKSPEDALTGPGEIPRLRAATHEVGHLMEVSVPGLKAMEWAFHTERTTDRTPTGAVKRENGLRSRTGLNAELPLALLTGQPSYGGEMARGDQYPMPYTGKGYGDGPSAMREMFTTMVESLLAGSAYGDEEMLAWALGVLATL